ncbi:MAG: IMP dehydrogenase, partial [Nitrosarchaeum sp.]|nr:IMP dehydrogenase [Nitrosarchaeum sp.]
MQNLNEIPLALTFDDVSLVPVWSTVKSRKEPDVSTVIGGTKLRIPIIASPMNTVCEEQMIWRMNAEGGSSVLHRYLSIEQQVKKAEYFKFNRFALEAEVPFYVALGSSGDYLERANALYNAGVKHFCVDVANGHSQSLLDAVRALKKAFPMATLMAGSVCTFDGAWNLVQAGATVIRVGIGNGSRCITRLVTGHGVPQMTALEECCRVKSDYSNVSIVADGGIRNSGD